MDQNLHLLELVSVETALRVGVPSATTANDVYQKAEQRLGLPYLCIVKNPGHCWVRLKAKNLFAWFKLKVYTSERHPRCSMHKPQTDTTVHLHENKPKRFFFCKVIARVSDVTVYTTLRQNVVEVERLGLTKSPLVALPTCGINVRKFIQSASKGLTGDRRNGSLFIGFLEELHGNCYFYIFISIKRLSESFLTNKTFQEFFSTGDESRIQIKNVGFVWKLQQEVRRTGKGPPSSRVSTREGKMLAFVTKKNQCADQFCFLQAPWG